MPSWVLERLMLGAGPIQHPTASQCRSLPDGSRLFLAGSWWCAALRSAQFHVLAAAAALPGTPGWEGRRDKLSAPSVPLA